MVTTSPTSLAALVAAAGSVRTTIWVNCLQTVTSNLPIPKTITLIFVEPGMLQPANGIGITLACEIIAPPALKIFDLSLGGVVQSATAAGQTNTLQSTWWIGWWGPTGDAVTNDAAVWNAAIVALTGAADTGHNSSPTLRIAGNPAFGLTASVSLARVNGFTIASDLLPGIGGFLGAPAFVSKFTTNPGATTHPLLIGERCTAITLEGIIFFCDENSNYGVKASGFDPGITSQWWLKSCTFTVINRVTGYSTNANWKGCSIAEDTAGANGEYFVFERCWFDGRSGPGYGGVTLAGTGIFVQPHDNSHGHTLTNCSFVALDRGLKGGLGVCFEGENAFSGNNISVNCTLLNMPMTLHYIDDEQSHQFLVTDFSSNFPIEVSNCRLELAGGAAGTALFDLTDTGSVTLIDNSIRNNAGAGTYNFSLPDTNNTSLTLINNRYPTSAAAMFKTSAGFSFPATLVGVNDGFAGTRNLPRQAAAAAGGVAFGDVIATSRGDAIAIAANAVTVEKLTHHVTNGGLIKTLTLGTVMSAFAALPVSNWVSSISVTLIADDAAGFTWDATSNIKRAGACAQFQAVTFTYDAGVPGWYPHA